MFGIGNNVRSRVVQECTPERFYKAIDSPQVARLCAEIEDALEAVRRGEMKKEDFETLKADRKKKLPVITPHATFRNGRRLNADAVPSGLSMYDVDHINDPQGYYRERVAGREKELGVVLAHITPSTEGLRLLFVIPRADMGLDAAQRWMSERLDNAGYDEAVKDLARCSFLVPRDYILYLDEEKLFVSEKLKVNSEKLIINNEEGASGNGVSSANADSGKKGNEAATGNGEDTGKEAATGNIEGSDSGDSSLTFKGIPYTEIIRQWFLITGGEPEKGERNTRLHRLASHLRYIADNNEGLILRVMPRYGLTEEETRGLIHSACSARFCSTPKEMKLAIENARMVADQNRTGVGTEASGDGTGDTEEQDEPPALPKRLPPLIRLLVSRTPWRHTCTVPASATSTTYGTRLP